MHMALKTRRWTRADLDRLPDDGNRYEIIDGALLVSPPPSVRHERLHVFLAEALRPYLRDQRLGLALDGRPAVIFGESHVEPDLIITPDILPVPDKWEDVPPPLLIVEVLSASTRRSDLMIKRDLYRREGIPEYWIVDGDARTVRVVDANGERLESETLRWYPAPATAALGIDLPALFTEALGPA